MAERKIIWSRCAIQQKMAIMDYWFRETGTVEYSIKLEAIQINPSATVAPQSYQFETYWMALNQNNHSDYLEANALDKNKLLERILIGNCLSFLKSMNQFVETRLHARVELIEKQTHFKNNNMIVFAGLFEINVNLPDWIGLGKQVSRGFGTIRRINS